MAERLYLEDVRNGQVFSPFVLPRTVKVSVNPKTMRPYYLVHWGAFDGAANLPLIYMATLEDSSSGLMSALMPRTQRRLKMLEPMTLPTATSVSPR